MKIRYYILLFLTFLLVSNSGFSKPPKYYQYFYLILDNSMNFNTTNGIYAPFIGCGKRHTIDKNAVDINLSFDPYLFYKTNCEVLNYKINLNYLRFSKKGLNNKYYYGIGGELLGIYCSDYFYLLKSPSFIFGKQFHEENKKYFIQLKICWPNYPHIWVKNFVYRIPHAEKQKRLWIANVFICTGVGF